ncbi:MAG: class I SAM-dependent methyltransferase [Chitinophagaceae bacterium]|nr:class I SAM-dependent methyltransferase [Chitinophagaceae bacterium]
MYQSFINYEEEFVFYNAIRQKYHGHSVLELGCGTGNMAGRFIKDQISFTGLDMSEEMLLMASQKYPQAHFVNAGMRNFELQQTFDFCLAAGRTVSYLITNDDVCNTFSCIYRHLADNGIVCFDFIEANRFIPLIQNGKQVVHSASYDNRNYKRISNWQINLQESYTFNWQSVYYEINDRSTEIFLGEDHSVIRAFTKEDIALFLQLTGFTVPEFINKPSYAFDTYVAVATKQKS